VLSGAAERLLSLGSLMGSVMYEQKWEKYMEKMFD